MNTLYISRLRSNTDRLNAGPRDRQRLRYGHGHRGGGRRGDRPRLPRAAARQQQRRRLVRHRPLGDT